MQGNTLHLAGANLTRRVEDIPLDSAPAFQSAVETRDTVVAMRTRGEMSRPIAELLGESPDGRFYLFPITTARYVIVAMLYADAGPGALQTDALELLAAVAGAVLEDCAPAAGQRAGQ